LFSGSVYGEDDLLKSFKKETTSPLSNTGKCQYINGWKGLPVEDMVASPDEKHVLFLEKDENNNIDVKLKLTKTGQIKNLDTLEYGSEGSMGWEDGFLNLNRVQFSKDGSIAVISGEHTMGIIVYDAKSWKKISTLNHATFSLNPSGKFLVVGGFSAKHGWNIKIYELSKINENYRIKFKHVISGRGWGDGLNKAYGLCLSGSSSCGKWNVDAEWYKGQEFGFSADGKYLIVQYLSNNYVFYEPKTHSIEKIICN
jgi:hypothetical protein